MAATWLCVLSVVVNFSGSVGRLAFESIVSAMWQSEVEQRHFAWLNTIPIRMGGRRSVPILVEMSGTVGIAYLAAVLVAALVSYVAVPGR